MTSPIPNLLDSRSTWRSEVTRLLILCLWGSFFLSLCHSGMLPAQSDGAYYVVTGKALASGAGFRDISTPQQKALWNTYSAFPLLLSAYWLLGASGMAFLMAAMCALLLLGSLVCYAWLRALGPPSLALLIAAGYSANSLFVVLGNTALSEVLFMPVLYAGMLFWVRWSHSRRLLDGLICIVLLVILARTRSVGLFFFATHVVVLVARKQWAIAGIGIALLGAWIGAEKLAVEPWMHTPTYTSGMLSTFPIFSDPVGTIARILQLYAHNGWSFAGSMFARIVFPWPYHLGDMNFVKRVLVLGVFIVGCAGGWRAWKKHRQMRPAIVAMLLTFLPIFTWTDSAQIFRYLFPYYPLFMLAVIMGVEEIVHLVKVIPFRWSGICIALIIAASQALYTQQQVFFTPADKDFPAVHLFISASSQKPGVVLSPISHYTHIQTGCLSLQVRSPRDIAAARAVCPGQECWLIANERLASSDSTALFQPSLLYRQGEWLLLRLP